MRKRRTHSVIGRPVWEIVAVDLLYTVVALSIIFLITSVSINESVWGNWLGMR